MIHGLSNDAEDRTEAARFGLAEMVSKALFAIDSLNFLEKKTNWTFLGPLWELSRHSNLFNVGISSKIRTFFGPLFQTLNLFQAKFPDYIASSAKGPHMVR